VKSILQAVPAYAMSCFLFTKKFCKQLSSISSNFWWGDSEGQKKVHWIGWDRMCKNKARGGLGFRDYECFNQAFLAKQGWRMITQPDSLCARVLKARYFKEGDFLTASCPKRASYTWRGIIHGRHLLRAGLVWRIGDGTSIKVHEDNWIPRSGAQCPLGQREEECPRLVSEFIVPEGGAWNEEMVRQHFFDIDVADILCTPVGRPGTQDFRAWNYTKNGVFSVRSAYHLAVKRKRDARGATESSRSCQDHKGWLALWDTPVPGKVKVHMWRLVENVLAVGSELSHRRIKDGVVCLACGRSESLVHRFWTCPHSASAWSLLSARTGVQLDSPPKRLACHADLKGWLLDWIGRCSADEAAWFFMLIYNLWLARNNARETHKLDDPSKIVSRTIAHIEEWRNLKSSGPCVAAPVERWLPPAQDWVKVNTDGAFRQECNGGAGVVI
jgi:hypothetical protein